jgi:zeaxanthin glucosyltransferase
MKIGFISPSIAGHFYPMSAVARQLQSRNHEVVMFALPPIAPLAQAANLPFVQFGEKEFPIEEATELVARLSRMKGWEGLEFTINVTAAVSEVKWHSLPKLIAAEGVDALVIDDYEFYAAALPMHLGMPYAVLSNALHFDYSGFTPLHVYDWKHENKPEAIARNREGVSKFTQMLIRNNTSVIALAEKAGIKANWSDPSSMFSDLPWITQCPKEFDFESSHWPKQFNYAGPFHDGKGRLDLKFPWKRLTGEPIIYASMGTVQNGNPEVFRTIVSAAAKHKDFQLIVSIGNFLTPEQIGPVPSNAIVVNNAPQLEILRVADLCVTHAGFNTTLEALSVGVPQIAIPVTNDQPGVAARIADRKTGKVASLEDLNPSNLSALIDEVLNEPIYLENSLAIQRAAAKKNGLTFAADLLEQAFGLDKKKENTLHPVIVNA